MMEPTTLEVLWERVENQLSDGASKSEVADALVLANVAVAVSTEDGLATAYTPVSEAVAWELVNRVEKERRRAIRRSGVYLIGEGLSFLALAAGFGFGMGLLYETFNLPEILGWGAVTVAFGLGLTGVWCLVRAPFRIILGVGGTHRMLMRAKKSAVKLDDNFTGFENTSHQQRDFRNL